VNSVYIYIYREEIALNGINLENTPILDGLVILKGAVEEEDN
jgi:hypothetical protein